MVKQAISLLVALALLVSPVLAADMPFDKTYTSSYSTVATVVNPKNGCLPLSGYFRYDYWAGSWRS